MRARARFVVPVASVAVVLAAYGLGPWPGLTHAGASTGITTLSFSTGSTIANPASLSAAGTVPITLTAMAGGSPAVNATVYVSFTPDVDGGGSVVNTQCANKPLNSGVTTCTTDTNGQVILTYTAPLTLPTGGHDSLEAFNSDPTQTPAPTVDSGATTYHFSKVTNYLFSPIPVASPGTLSSAAMESVNVQAIGADGNPVTSDAGGSPPHLWVEITQTGGAAMTAMLTASSGTCSPGGTNLTTFTSEHADNTGTVALCFTAPVTATSEIDTITVRDTQHSGPDAMAIDGYNSNTVSSPALTVSPSPIAAAASLQSGDPVVVSYTMKSGGTAVQYAPVSLTLTGEPGDTAPSGSATVGWQSLGTTGTAFETDATGTVVATFTAGSASSGADRMRGTGLSQTTDDWYDYAAVDHFTFSASPLAPRGTLAAGALTPNPTITAVDALGNAVPHAGVTLTFSPTTARSSDTSSTMSANGNTLSPNTAAGATADTSGVITLVYTVHTVFPGGQDTISVTDGTTQAQDEYQFGNVASYTFSTGSHIAPTGSLQGGTPVNFTVLGTDVGGATDTTTPIWLTFTQASGGGGVGVTQCTDASGTAITSLTPGTPARCTPDSHAGTVQLTYTAPQTLPTAGTDSITAADARTNPAATPGVASYGFLSTYAFSATPIAATGTLAPVQARNVTVTAEDSNHNAAPNATVYLSLSGAGHAIAGAVTLTSTPQAVQSDGSGNITVTYQAPSALPNGGSATVTAASDATGTPAIQTSDTYTFVGGYTLSPAGPTIAPDASLGGGSTKTVVATVTDSHGTAAPSALAWVSFTQAAGGGSLTANGASAGSAPMQVTADSQGQITLRYTTPSTLPKSGTDVVTLASQSSSPAVSVTDSYTFTVPPPTQGYWLVASDGGLFPFGAAASHSYGSTGNVHLNEPIVGMVPTASNNGYWLVASDGGIFPFGDAQQHSYGSTGNVHLNAPIVGMERTASGNGYWLVASDGGIFPFGDAQQHSYGSTGNVHLNAPILGMKRTASGNGYWLFARDGGIFPFGDAQQHSYGSTGNLHLNAPIVGMERTASGNGYWMVASDGGIFPFGDAQQHSYGSTGNVHLNAAIVGMSRTASGNGYWLVASDGGIFPFGPDAGGWGSTGNIVLNKPIIGMASIG